MIEKKLTYIEENSPNIELSPRNINKLNKCFNNDKETIDSKNSYIEKYIEDDKLNKI